ERGMRDTLEREGCRTFNAHPPHAVDVEGQCLSRQWLTTVPSLLVGVAEAERHGILRADQRATSFEVGEKRRTVSHRKREFHGRGLPVWIRLRLVEVRVPIHEQNAEPARP